MHLPPSQIHIGWIFTAFARKEPIPKFLFDGDGIISRDNRNELAMFMRSFE
jgi:hypothetical protein